MKIAHMFWGLSFGGIETMLVNIANAQQRVGADVSIIIINDMCEPTLLQSFDCNIKIIRLGRKRRSKNPMFIYRLNMELKRMNPDVIHLHGSYLFPLILNRNLKQITCSTLHDLPFGTMRRKGILPKLFPFLHSFSTSNVTYIDKVPRVFAISQAVKDELWKKYGVNSVVINNGIITSQFLPRAPKEPDQPFRIVQVGRLEYNKKGQDLLIESVARLKGKVQVYFIGSGSSMEYLQQLTHALGTETYVRFLGSQTQVYVAQHLKDYDLFVQPSRYEGFGLTVAEAMAAQVPVLVSAGQGPAEVTCGERYGWTFENGNVDKLCEKITYLSTHYEDAIEKARLARQYVIDTYDVSTTARHYLEEYDKFLKSTKH